MNRTHCRALALALAIVALFATVLPVTAQAAGNESAWVELLEFSTVNNTGSNLFKITTTGTISIDTPQYMRCTKVDMLITYPSGYAPTSVKLRYNGTLYPLTMEIVDSTTARVFGDNIPDTLYANLVFQINKSGTTAIQYQVLSCRVSSLLTQEFVADADVYVQGTFHPIATMINVPGDTGSDSGTVRELVLVRVYDWVKYDTVTIWGSATHLPINSIRATLGTAGIPMTVSYMDSANAGYWITLEESESGLTTDGIYSGDDLYWGEAEIVPEGTILFCLTFDMSEVDRTQYANDPLSVYFSGLYETVWGYSFNCQYVSGSIVVADTTNASWWARFTAFFTDLLGGDKEEDGEEFADTMESQSQQMQEAVQDMNEVTRPAVEDVQVSVDEYVNPEDMDAVGDIVGGLMENQLVSSMVMISLILSLAAYVIYGKR